MITNAVKMNLKEFITDNEKVNLASGRCYIIYRVIRSKMLTKHFSHPSRIVFSDEAERAKRYLVFLILVTAFGVSGFCSVSPRESNTSWDFTFSSTIFNHHLFDTIVQEMYLIPENEDSLTPNSKDSPEGASVFVRYSLRSSILDSCLETLLDSINCFRYELTYGYSPLRSPPLFS